MNKGVSCPLCHEVLRSVKQYQRHVGKHQEQLSLFALPSDVTDGQGVANEQRSETDDEVRHDSPREDVYDVDCSPEETTVNQDNEYKTAPSENFPPSSRGDNETNERNQADLEDEKRSSATGSTAMLQQDDIMRIIHTTFPPSHPGQAAMDSIGCASSHIKSHRRVVGAVPAEIRKWVQLRQLIANNPDMNTLETNSYLNQCQIGQFKQLWERKRGATAPNAPVPQQPAGRLLALPPGTQYPSDIAQITPNDIQNIRRLNPAFAITPEEDIIENARRS